MDDVTDRKALKNKAHNLRRAANYKEALEIYKILWSKDGDRYDGCGLLSCLRKMGMFDEAIPLADELIIKFNGFEWCRNEVIWTYIEGKLNKLTNKETLENVIGLANEIILLQPQELAYKTIVFKVLRRAKLDNKWEIINEWVTKITQESLNNEPMKLSSGKEGWSDLAQWYNFRIKGLIERPKSKQDLEEVLKLTDEAINLFTKHKKFFLRLKARAYQALGNLEDADKIYQDLCFGVNIDWWFLHEFAIIEKELGRENKALELMFQAAGSKGELKGKVSLFADIGTLCNKLNKPKEAFDHFALAKSIREEQGWSVPISISSILDMLGKAHNYPSLSKQEALQLCQNEWGKNLASIINYPNRTKRKTRTGLIGDVSLGRTDQPFAFIITKDENIFCFKSDLPQSITNGEKVSFDALPSFDKRKNVESWKATNIMILPKQL